MSFTYFFELLDGYLGVPTLIALLGVGVCSSWVPQVRFFKHGQKVLMGNILR